MLMYTSVFVYSMTIWLHLNNLTLENVNEVVIKEPIVSVCLPLGLQTQGVMLVRVAPTATFLNIQLWLMFNL